MKPNARILLQVFVALANPLAAQVNLSENFDSMGTGTAAPSGLSFYGWTTGSKSTWVSSIPLTDIAGGNLNTALSTLTPPTT